MFQEDRLMENKELCELVEYGYDLHRDKMDYSQTVSVPSMQFSAGNICLLKEVPGGGIFGKRSYSNHSTSDVYTTLGISVGAKEKDGFKLDYALMMQANNASHNIVFSFLKIKENKSWKKTLGYDTSIFWSELTEEEQTRWFCKFMVFLGFRFEDVIAVLNGKLTAREAFLNVAPENIKNKSWVSFRRRYYVFDGNMAIEGNFSGVNIDEFPFPFEGSAILDCSKVKTTGIDFGANKRGVKLTNVNERKDSITYANLKNAIIDEMVDLAKVDATRTKFGCHKVINIDSSIASIDGMDLSLSLDEKGESNLKKSSENILFFASADDGPAALTALENLADGIGLVRTESILDAYKDINGMIDYLTECLFPEENQDFLERFRALQKKQADHVYMLYVCGSFSDPIIFRLLDFKLKEALNMLGRETYEDEDLGKMRASYFLADRKELLEAQVQTICASAFGKTKMVYFLIPYVRDVSEFVLFKKQIMEIASQYGFTSISVGAMIEDIDMAYEADSLAEEADFICIGTNDLTQSILGQERDIARKEFSILTDDVEDVIIEAIRLARSKKPNIGIGICGDHGNYIENMDFYGTLDINYICCAPEFIESNRRYLKESGMLTRRLVKRKEE